MLVQRSLARRGHTQAGLHVKQLSNRGVITCMHMRICSRCRSSQARLGSAVHVQPLPVEVNSPIPHMRSRVTGPESCELHGGGTRACVPGPRFAGFGKPGPRFADAPAGLRAGPRQGLLCPDGGCPAAHVPECECRIRRPSAALVSIISPPA